ncbi:sugar transferase [Caldifermentibacillus hisashii]|uniref:sugar transferase n=1 Tax=Caldifermentibacillus hisashii TaxID=996558 RepID=UPI0022B95679|nr:sugar transferase [Caldifermentibacillus hisashii]
MYQKYVKRFLDIIFSLILIPILIIVFIPVAIIIKLDDRGPVFYKGKRLGYKMTKFNMYKFRTMKVGAPDIRNKDGSTYNSESDPRLTRIGRVLRKTSIDELPQIYNVLIGDMSFVGPRPSPLGNEKKYTKEYLKKFDVKPGITGYNQATLRNSATMEQRIKNDLYYVENISFLFDLKILIWTLKSVLLQKNIYRR